MRNYKAIISVNYKALDSEGANRRARYLLYLFDKMYKAEIVEVKECIVK